VKSEDPQTPPQDGNSDYQFDSRSGDIARKLEAGREDEAGNRDLGDILSQALKIYQNNPVIILPSLIPIVTLALGMLIFAGYLGLMTIFADGGFLALSFMASLLLFVILMVVLIFLAEGASIEMIRQASMGRAADLSAAWKITRRNLEPLVLPPS